jgi:hypothetical protein
MRVKTTCLIGLVLAAGTVGCGGGSGASGGHAEPARTEAVEGSDFKLLTLTPRASERLGIRTAAVTRHTGDRGARAMPYAALIYGNGGETYAYTSPEANVFVRAPVKVQAIDGDTVVLSAGPPVGTDVVDVGAAELYGEELGVGH